MRWRAFALAHATNRAVVHAGPPARNKTKRAGIWQRTRLALLFAIIAALGFGAYAGYAKMIRSPGGEGLAHVHRVFIPPTLWVRSTHAVADTHVPDEMSAWLGKVGRGIETVAIVVFGDLASTAAAVP